MERCHIIRDLLPSYCDGLTNPDTSRTVEAHLKECSGCSAALERMRQKEAQQAEAFQAALAQHRRAENRSFRKWAKLGLWVLAGALCLWFLAQQLSLSLCLAFSGLSEKQITVVEQTIEYSDKTSQVATFCKNGQTGILTLSKDRFFNVWYVDSLEVTTPKKDVITAFWFGPSTHRTYNTPLASENTIRQYNLLYCGNNATRLINIPADRLPQNLTLSIWQQGSCYRIHVTTHSGDAFNQLELTSLLSELNCTQ